MSARRLSALAAHVLRQAPEPDTDDEALVVPTRRDETGQPVEHVLAESPLAADHWRADAWRARP